MNRAPPPQSDPFGLVGSVLDRQFRVDALVGEGGFGVVYKGWHLSLEQPIAIKALKIPETRDPRVQATVLSKFRDEAKLSYVLSQVTLNVVRTIDFGATTAPTGAWVPFAVLEWLEGETLAEHLARRRAQGMRGRPLTDAMKLLEPAARALAIAHQRRVAHRDIKPGNFFLLAPQAAAAGATIKLLDFGIAKVMREDASAAGATSTGMLSFTPQYAAPEQIDQRYGATGPWTDVYGFALVLTEVLTDRAPFEAAEVTGVVVQVLDATRRPTPRTRGASVPDPVEAACARALAVDPKQRWIDASAFWSALEAALARSTGGVAATLPMDPATQQAAAAARAQAAQASIVVARSVPPPGAILPPPGPPVFSSAPPAWSPPAHYVPVPAPAHGSRALTIVAVLVGIALGLLLLALGALFVLTRHR